MDIDNMKTGWCYSAGVAGQAPDWKWNPTLDHFQPKPGDDYKKGLQIRCAIGGGQAATWRGNREQGSIGNAFTELATALQQRPGDGSCRSSA